MNKKCTKFEALFTFCEEKDFLEHIKNCPDCAKEYENMQKISSLIQEVKPHFKKKQRNFTKLKVACTILFIFISGISFSLTNTDVTDTLKYGTTLSAEDLGFPVDSYGLILVE